MKVVRRGSHNVAAVAGARGVAVRTGSRHCCVGNPAAAAAAAAALRLQCRESETSPSLPADGTLRHLNAAAAQRPRLCPLRCLQIPSEIMLHGNAAKFGLFLLCKAPYLVY